MSNDTDDEAEQHDWSAARRIDESGTLTPEEMEERDKLMDERFVTQLMADPPLMFIDMKRLKLQLNYVHGDTRETGWSGYKGKLVHDELFDWAYSFAEQIPTTILAPSVKPYPSGNLALTWFESPDFLFSVTFSLRGIIGVGTLHGVKVHIASDYSTFATSQILHQLEIFTEAVVGEKSDGEFRYPTGKCGNCGGTVFNGDMCCSPECDKAFAESIRA